MADLVNIPHNQYRFKGYLQTKELWDGKLQGLSQYKIKGLSTLEFKLPNKQLRLGHLVEQLVFVCLRENKNIELLETNIQIIQDKKTIGELDCLIIDKGKPIHLEIVYKFYLFDPSISGNEIDSWIGPNRNDSLKQKLAKLKTKQMPLLYHPKSNEILNGLGYNSEMLDQRVHFKAQLFIPLGYSKQLITKVNRSCIIGFYMTLKELALFKQNEFFIPSKLDWLIHPHSEVLWLSYSECLAVIQIELNQSRSPLCWMKDPKGNITKLFVVFW